MRPIHWLIVILVLIILFGASKLPDIAKNIGKSAKVLKKELNDLQDDDSSQVVTKAPENKESQQTPPATEPTPPDDPPTSK